jgi:hypothetical protein
MKRNVAVIFVHSENAITAIEETVNVKPNPNTIRPTNPIFLKTTILQRYPDTIINKTPNKNRAYSVPSILILPL